MICWYSKEIKNNESRVGMNQPGVFRNGKEQPTKYMFSRSTGEGSGFFLIKLHKQG